MTNIKSRSQSDYFKDHNPYIHDGAKHGRKPDTIFLVVFKTPTGRWAKHFAHYRFSGEYKCRKVEEVRNTLKDFLARLDYSNGKTVHEVIQYSGETDYTGLNLKTQ